MRAEAARAAACAGTPVPATLITDNEADLSRPREILRATRRPTVFGVARCRSVHAAIGRRLIPAPDNREANNRVCRSMPRYTLGKSVKLHMLRETCELME